MFSASTERLGERALYSADRATGATVALGVTSPGRVASTGDHAFFAVGSAHAGVVLWRTDGTPPGTTSVRDLPGVPLNLTAVGSRIFFSSAETGDSDRELWVSDGTAEGTLRVADVRPGVASSFPTPLAAVGGELWFAADDGVHGSELWRTDGTEAGTRLVADLAPGRAADGRPRSSSPSDVVVAGDSVYFVADDGRGASLWVTDLSGTKPHEVVEGAVHDTPRGDIRPMILGDRVLFGLRGSADESTQLWSVGVAEGSAIRVGSVPLDLAPGTRAVLGEDLYYVAKAGRADYELWRTNGTVEGTAPVADFDTGQSEDPNWAGSQPGQLTVAGGRLFFLASDEVHGRSLWSYAPGEDAPFIAEDVDLSDSNDGEIKPALFERIDDLRAVGDDLYLSVGDPEHGVELWSTAAPSADVPRVTYAAAPKIEGVPEVGSTLTADPGEWSPSTATLRYQWLVEDRPVPGATSPTFVLDESTANRYVRLRVAGAHEGYRNGGAATSAVLVSGHPRNLVRPTIVGTPRVGSTLTLRVGTWSPGGLNYTNLWYVSGKPVDGATGRTFRLPASAAGRRVSVVVRAKKADWMAGDATSASTAPVDRATFRVTRRPTVSGTPRVGSTLRVSAGSATPAAGSTTVYWLRDGKRTDATGSTYRLRPADAGHRVSAEVRRSRRGWRTSVATTGATRRVIG